MPALSWLTCKAFIEQQPPREQKRLLEFLPEKERKQMGEFRFTNTNWTSSSVRIDDALDLIHPSWIMPHIRSFGTQEIGFLLSALGTHQAGSLKSQLHFMRPLPPLTPLGKAYLRGDLLQKIAGVEDLAPLKALPDSPLNILSTLSFKDLLKLIFSLGLKDLGQYLKLVIDKNKRIAIESALSPEEWKTLQQLSLKKDPLAGGKEGFDTWNAKPEKLRLLIEQRGINRLAKALFGEHPSLLWYVMHILDMSRANFLHKLCQASPSKATQDVLREQVVDTVNSFKSE